MKILHITSCRELSAGQRKQLQYEEKAAGHLVSFTWDIAAFQIHPPEDYFESRYPAFFRLLMLRNLYTWLYLFRKSSQYDIVLLRHMTFDPFLFVFGFFVRNRLSVHHSKAIEELKLVRRDWRGKAASLLERFTGFVNSRQVKGVLGVTGEIAAYEVATHKAKCPAGVYPNGIDTEQIALLEDRREKDVHIAFMCGKFTPWHGLDRLLVATEYYESAESPEFGITIHLIGSLDQEQLQSIRRLDLKYSEILCHGHLGVMEYRDILAKCDIGLGSLAMDRQNLSEGAILKVRDYLASGLSVYSGCSDAAIPKDFPYYLKGPVDLNHIITYALEMKPVSREVIREESIPYIEKYNIMVGLCEWLKENIE
jgi:hypothetical protein